ncbi:GRB2-associated-binding protein 1-like isoform X2 [Babylonia areolata]|uniref:GRB2-associated-binding protein 1-like isoform X2 n=1 Tax=Babylonia areolata TaxID=304850 RepID=UPI003FD06E28
MCFLKVGGNSNKRLGAMNKLTNVVHAGWMIKSPPEQKLKIFRAKWKQRFFVLHKPSGSLPDQYELSYYSSEQCSKKKGTIDLEQCEQIIESIDSDQYPYLLAIKTVCRGKVRTYHLATSSEEEMGTWVQCLCRVCSLKQEDSPTDIPDSRHSLPGLSASSAGAGSTGAAPNSSVRSTSSVTPSVTPSVTSQPVQAAAPRPSNITSSTSSTNSHPAPSTSPQSYVFLNECTTGKRSDRYGRTDSIDSVPEYQAPPPPPAKRGPQLATAIENDSPRSSLHDSVFEVYDHPPTATAQDTSDTSKSGGQEVYDRPRSREFRGSDVSLDDDAFYKVPPTANGQMSLAMIKRNSESSDVVDLNAAVPLPKPRRSPRSACSSQSDRPSSIASTGRPGTENYDVPPPRHVSTSSQEGMGLNCSPSTPPLRPPKPHNLMAQSPYQNLPTTGKSYENTSLSAVPAAPPKPCGVSIGYDVPRSSPFVSPPRDHSVLDMAPPAPAPRSCGPAGGHAYLNTVPGMGNSPSVPPLPNTYRSSETTEPDDLVYADMDGPALNPQGKPPPPTSDLVYADMVGAGEGQDQAPPLAPRPPARFAMMPPPRVVPDSDAQNLRSCLRTKSYIRNSQGSMSPALPARPPPLEPRQLPLPARTEFASSSEDDDDLSMDGNNTHHDLSVVRMSTVPAAPDIDMEPELKYLDLALDTPPDPARPQAAAFHGTPTEYREIDFVKTRALQDTKKARDMKK